MFERWDGFTRSLLSRLSSETIFTASEASERKIEENYPLLKTALNDTSTWMDLCYHHYRLKPFRPEDAKNFFQGEYLYHDQKLEQAAKKGSMNALSALINHHIQATAYEKAISYAQVAIQHYGLLGHLLMLQIYKKIIDSMIDEVDKEPYINSALTALDEIKKLKNDDKSNYYLETFKWKENIEEHYGGLDKFIEMARDSWEKENDSVASMRISLT